MASRKDGRRGKVSRTKRETKIKQKVDFMVFSLLKEILSADILPLVPDEL